MDIARERLYLYLLNCLPQISNRKIVRMYEASGSFEGAYKRELREYIELGLFKSEGACFGFDKRFLREEQLLKQYEGFGKRGIRLVSYMDEDYPLRLRGLPDAPLLLYVRGRLPGAERPAVAVIGSRSCSGYGLYAAEYFSRELARCGADIISGMASGIDAASQRAALHAGFDSFAVLGGGVDRCYPWDSHDIYELMCSGRGGVISEAPPWAESLGWRFVARNRIIAGLCDVIIVAEARRRSGTSITVEHALSYGREVFAVPHRFTDATGEGCNALIRDGAYILNSLEEVLDHLGLDKDSSEQGRGKKDDEPRGEMWEKAKHKTDDKAGMLARFEKIVYSCLDFNERHIEEIAERSGLSLRDTRSAIYGLSIKGLAYSPEASYYRKVE